MAHADSSRPISEVAAGLDLTPSQIVPYGSDKAKVTLDALDSGRACGRRRHRPAEAVMAHAERRAKPFEPLYGWREAIPAKMEKIARAMYGAREVAWTREAQRALGQIESLGFGGLPLCVAKTQKSLTDDPRAVGRPEEFDVTVRDVVLAAGAGYVVPLLGDIMRMPGLPASPQAERMDLVDGEVVHASPGPGATTSAPA